MSSHPICFYSGRSPIRILIVIVFNINIMVMCTHRRQWMMDAILILATIIMDDRWVVVIRLKDQAIDIPWRKRKTILSSTHQ